MSLNKTAYKNGIKALLDELWTSNGLSSEQARERFATVLSDLGDAFVKTGTVTVATGITLTSTGTSSFHTGSTNGLGTGTIS
jgi:hypothetical protein